MSTDSNSYVPAQPPDEKEEPTRWYADEKPAPSALERQVDGDHYKKFGNYQPYAVLSKWLTDDELRGYAKGAAIAYLARERSKGELQDIKKAIHTLQLYLELK